MRKAMIKRLQTGVPGLDEILGGGLPELSFNLLAGAPGSGKTSLAHQMMFAMATPERPALYFTVLGEPPLKMLRYQQQFDYFDIDKLNRSIRFINLAEEAGLGSLDKVLRHIVAEVETHEPGFVFVDSFRSLTLSSPNEGSTFFSLQRFAQELGVLMASWQATTFLIGEYAELHEPNPLFTVSDGLIWLRQSVQGNSMVRKIEILKMRGQATQPGSHTFRMSANGIQVFAVPPLSSYPKLAPEFSAKARLSMGVPGLDEMLGGGLPRGYFLLVAGPSGSGKSILAGAFLDEGARVGEIGIIAAFERRWIHSRGERVAALVRAGQISVVDTESSDLSVEELGLLLMAEIRRLDARRVVIDSLSGFELALAPSLRKDFRQSLARMLAALASTGATVLMTVALENHDAGFHLSPDGAALLSDAIIVQRYVETDGRRQRVLSVLKVRSSDHSSTLHRYHIDDEGMRIGEPLAARAWTHGRRLSRQQNSRAVTSGFGMT